MKISSRGRYGLRAIVDIASWGGENGDKCVTLKSVAERNGISENYLEQLAAALKKAGYVKSVRGAQGGYVLAVRPGGVTAAEILKSLEGPMYPTECVNAGSAGAGCGASCENCVTKGVWDKLYASLNDTLSSITLEDLVNEYKRLRVRPAMTAENRRPS